MALCLRFVLFVALCFSLAGCQTFFGEEAPQTPETGEASVVTPPFPDAPEAAEKERTDGEPTPVKAEQVSCDKPMPVLMCCQAMIPSCESCNARNRRMQEEWRRRCGR